MVLVTLPRPSAGVEHHIPLGGSKASGYGHWSLSDPRSVNTVRAAVGPVDAAPGERRLGKVHLMSRIVLVLLGLLCAQPRGQAQAPAVPDALVGWKSQVELDALVATLRRGELKGPQTLFERPRGPYRIYTSFIDNRRGAADIHETDDEIFIVLSGGGRSTLGGDIADPRATAAHEIRGTRIVDGVSRTVGVGDIISAPRGTPHQMDATGGHILYVVIKIIGLPAS